MERELTWQERENLLTENQRRGKVPDKNGIYQGDFGDLSPFNVKIIHYFLDCHEIPRTINEKNNKNMKPITPTQLLKEKPITPEMEKMIANINDLLSIHFNGGSVNLKQEKIIENILKLKPDLNRDFVFDNYLLNFKLIYQQYGWEVEVDRPGYNESYNMVYTFTPKGKIIFD